MAFQMDFAIIALIDDNWAAPPYSRILAIVFSLVSSDNCLGSVRTFDEDAAVSAGASAVCGGGPRCSSESLGLHDLQVLDR